MNYRIKIDLAYPSDTNPRSILAHTQSLLEGAVIINPGTPTEERGYIQLEKCYHDEHPTRPCEIIDYIQL